MMSSRWTVSLLLVICLSSASAPAQTMNVLFNFTPGTTGNGNYPITLIHGPNGSYYGATYFGGANNAGVVFQMNPPAAAGDPWTETILYSFGSDEALPDQLVLDKDGVLGIPGALYGTTNNSQFLFQLTPPDGGRIWGYTVIRVGEALGLVISPQGVLYGTETESDQLFQLSQSGGAWTFTPLYTFSGQYETPTSLTLDSAGNLYGTDREGGSGYGEVIKLVPPSVPGGAWTETVLHTFMGNDGSYPSAIIVGEQGNLFGTTQQGGGHKNGGVVWRLAPSSGGTYSYRVLYRFTGGSSNDSEPTGLTFYRNALYGFTAYVRGTIYKLTISSGTVTKTTLFNFEPAPGGYDPAGAPLLASDGSIFGVTEDGGTGLAGTFYQFVP